MHEEKGQACVCTKYLGILRHLHLLLCDMLSVWLHGTFNEVDLAGIHYDIILYAAILAQVMRRLLISCPTHPHLWYDRFSILCHWCAVCYDFIQRGGCGTPTHAATLSEQVRFSPVCWGVCLPTEHKCLLLSVGRWAVCSHTTEAWQSGPMLQAWKRKESFARDPWDVLSMKESINFKGNLRTLIGNLR